MKTGRFDSGVILAAAALAALAGAPTAAQEYETAQLEARVWLDRGEEPLLQRGERVRIYYRVSHDAFVAIFHIDTNGTARLVFPTSPQENHFARGGRDYRILFPGSSYWYVDDYPGMGYFFIVASPAPFDLSRFRYSHFDGGWDLSFVGRQVYRDPYLAMDDYVAALLPDWEYLAYGLDFTAYHVGRHYEYPRFLCYDCHGFRPYYSWNPYAYTCASFMVVIYNDPYFYPVTRYRASRVVYVEPRRGVPRFAFKERAAGEAGTPQVVVKNPSQVAQPGVEGTAVRRPAQGVLPPSGAPGAAQRREAPPPAAPAVDARRPSAGVGGGGTAVVPLTAPPARGGAVERPVLERRAPSSGTPPPATPRGTPPPAGTTPPAVTPTTRPTDPVRRREGGAGTVQQTGSGRSTPTTPPAATRGSGGAVVFPPAPRSTRGTAAPVRTPAAQRSGSTVRQPAQSSGSTVRQSAQRSGSTVRQPARAPAAGNAAAVRPPATAPPRTTTPPPVVRRPGGGGGS